MQTSEENASRFLAEVSTAIRWINAILAADSSSTDQRDSAVQTIDRYLAAVARVEQSAKHVSNTGLISLCVLLETNLVVWRDEDRALSADERSLLEQWPGLLLRYLETPADDDTCLGLVRHLSDPHWKMPLSTIEGDELARMLKQKEKKAVAHREDECVGVMSSQAEEAGLENFKHPASALPVTGEAEKEEIMETATTVSAEPVQGDELLPAVVVLPDSGMMLEADVPPVEETPSPSGVDPADGDTAVEAWNDPSVTILNDEPRGAETSMLADNAPDNAPAPDNELVQLLRDELATSSDAMAHMLATMSAPDAEPAAHAQALADYLEQVERLMLVSEAMGLAGLQQVFAQMQANLPAVDDKPCAVSIETAQLLEVSSRLALDYLGAVGDIAASVALADHLQAAGWPRPLAVDDVLSLADLLSNPALTTADDESAPRQVEANADDVSLAVPEDINPELLDALLQELPVQMGAFTGAMQRIAVGSGVLMDLDDAKRAAHTLKGAANTVGVRGIANLTHHLEDILIALSQQEAMPNRALAVTLLNAGDCLEAMSETLLGIGEEPADAMQILQEVLNWANRIDQDGVPAPDETMPAGYGTVAAPESGQKEQAAAATQLATPMLRVPASVVDEVLRLAGEMIIANGQLQERLRQARKQSKIVSHQQLMFQQLTAELENLVDIRGASARLHRSEDKAEFDPLEFEHYSELHTITRRLIKAATDGREMSAQSDATLLGLNEVLESQHRLHVESQNAVMRTRMVAVNTIFSRLQRSVRQTCRLLDKQVELKLAGAQTFVDSNVLGDLVDPLMHVLRNAIDHGIESAEIRRERGKHPVGHIDLSFSREGNYLVVRCQDDGGGLNLDAIRVAAADKGMISPDDMLMDDEIGRLILVPGFSTRTEASQVSGRGIGMDVVYSRVLEMKGSLHLHTETGGGLTVELRIPATLISTHGLLVRLRDKLLAVSSRGVEDIHYVAPEQIKLLGNGYTYHVNEQVHEVVSLEALLDLPEDRRQLNRSGFPALMVRLDSGALRAILVQEVLDSRDLVVKSLGRYVPKSRGVIGATILDDGSVAPVIDMPELLRNLGRFERGQTEPRSTDSAITEREPSGPSDKAGRLALVIDDSLTARRAAAEIMRNAGYEVHAAMDGVEAVSMIEKKVPDIILVDMEMPRMNGLEFTAHIRSQEATRQIPVIMITSRSTDKHRQQATAAGVNAYLTKPFNSDHLLDQVATLCGGR